MESENSLSNANRGENQGQDIRFFSGMMMMMMIERIKSFKLSVGRPRDCHQSPSSSRSLPSSSCWKAGSLVGELSDQQEKSSPPSRMWQKQFKTMIWLMMMMMVGMRIQLMMMMIMIPLMVDGLTSICDLLSWLISVSGQTSMRLQ